MNPVDSLENDPTTSETTGRQKRPERAWVWFFCALAAAHVFIFSSVFPFFNNVDESNHFDLTVKYARGNFPKKVQPISAEAMQYIAIFGSQEFAWPANFFPDGHYPPPPWKQSPEQIRRYVLANEINREKILNYEDSQPPLYYALAGSWLRLGQLIGFEGGNLLYWIRFLNVVLIVIIVYLGYETACYVFPDDIFLQLGVPLSLAFIPQTALYSIENDILSPITFGLAFLSLLKFFERDKLTMGWGIAAGFSLAATYLTKISNLPLVAIAVAFLLFQAWLHNYKGRHAISAFIPFVLSFAVPILIWLCWSKIAFGDFTGSAKKMEILGWTIKPFSEWWSHPIFTLKGLFIFLCGLASTFWQGEFYWHQKPINFETLNLLYFLLTTILLIACLQFLLSARQLGTSTINRKALWFAFLCLGASVLFLGFLSIIYDFHDCFYPSREHPYFTSGRLMLGALIPLFLLFICGLGHLMKRFSLRSKFFVLSGGALAMLIGEIATDWPVFSSAYNWFHM